MSDPTECMFVDSDTRCSWNPSTMLPGTTFHRPISQTHANRPITKDRRAGIVSMPKTPGIMAGMDQMCSYVDDESKNKRGVSKLRYPVEHGVATN